MKHLVKKTFNMVEIVIALVIILVLLVGVLSLIPDSLNKQTTAMNRIASNDASEQFLNYFAARVVGNWETELTAFPNSLEECATETSAQFSQEGDTVGTRLLASANVVLMHNATNENAAYTPAQVGGLYKVVQRTSSNLTDFEGIVRVWKKVEVLGEGQVDLSQARSCEIFAELSWPATMPYAARKKSVSSIKVFRPGQTYAQAPTAEEDCVSKGQIGGLINLNPSNNSDFSFDMTTTTNQQITRGDLLANGNSYTFNGTVKYIRFRPKGNGGQTTLTLNGQTYDLKNKHTYELRGNAIRVSLYNSHSNNGHAMGKWYLDIANSEINLDYDCLDNPDTEVEEEVVTDLFEITGGAVVPLQPVRTTVQVLGCAITSGGKPCYVTAYIKVGGTTYKPWGNPTKCTQGNINDGKQHSFDAGILQAGKEISVVARCYLPDKKFYMEKASNPANQNVMVLRNGDSVPDISGFENQDGLESYIQNHINTETKKVTIAANQAILLFELGTTNMNSSAADFQDMVVLVTMTPED
jgi:type II secretory pathway pseudopilin PulG